MHRLLYISTAREPITASVLENILRVSRRNNAACGVTGLLITGGARFLQALEGESAAVHATFARIANDPRHFATVVLHDAQTNERAFADWAMGSVAGGAAPADAATGTALDLLLAPIDDPVLRGYFDGFVAIKRAA